MPLAHAPSAVDCRRLPCYGLAASALMGGGSGMMSSKHVGAATLALLAALANQARASTSIVTDDATLSKKANTGLGNWESIAVSNDSQRGFLHFDLSSYPSDSLVTRATLRLFVETVKEPGLIDLHAVADDWSEATITNANAPFCDPEVTALASVNHSSEGHFIAVDVTTLVQGWIKGSTHNAGIALMGNESDPVSVEFDSK